MKNTLRINSLLAGMAIFIFNAAFSADDAWKQQKAQSLAEQLQKARTEKGRSAVEGPALPPRDKPKTTDTQRPPALTPPPSLKLPSDSQMQAAKADEAAKQQAAAEAKKAEQKQLLEEMRQSDIKRMAKEYGTTEKDAAELYKEQEKGFKTTGDAEETPKKSIAEQMLDTRTNQLIKQGKTPEEARRQAEVERSGLEKGLEDIKSPFRKAEPPKTEQKQGLFAKARQSQAEKTQDTPQSWRSDFRKLSTGTIADQKTQKAMWAELEGKDAKYLKDVTSELKTDHATAKEEITIANKQIKQLQGETKNLEKQLKKAKTAATRQEIYEKLAATKESIDAMTSKNLEKGVNSAANYAKSANLTVQKLAAEIKNTPKPTTSEEKKALASKKADLKVAQAVQKAAKKEVAIQNKALASQVKANKAILTKISAQQKTLDNRIELLNKDIKTTHLNQPKHIEDTQKTIDDLKQQRAGTDKQNETEYQKAAGLYDLQKRLQEVQ